MSNKLGLSTIILVFGVVLLSCTPQKRYSVLSFFFDGVPDPEGYINDSTNGFDERKTTSFNLAITSENRNITYFHVPYKEQQCNECHSDINFTELKSDMPSLCYQCHTNYSEKYVDLHGPVEGGFCTSCHNPHKANQKSFLRKNINDICYQCHDKDLITSLDYHSVVEGFTCVECHDPHGGGSMFLKEGVTCFKCHDSFNQQYAYLHGPVASNYCTVCHVSHSAKVEGNLKSKDRMLCLYCHSEVLVMRNEVHEGTESFSCLECHNPHGGGDKFILR